MLHCGHYEQRGPVVWDTTIERLFKAVMRYEILYLIALNIKYVGVPCSCE